MATVLHQQSSDIFVKDRPVGLSSHAPAIFQDYAISRDTAISIMPSMEKLLADPTFRGSVRETLGKVTLVDIKVSGEDGYRALALAYQITAAIEESLQKNALN